MTFLAEAGGGGGEMGTLKSKGLGWHGISFSSCIYMMICLTEMEEKRIKYKILILVTYPFAILQIHTQQHARVSLQTDFLL